MRHTLPWFDLYDADRAYLSGSETLRDVWSVAEMDEAKIGLASPIDESVELAPGQVVGLPLPPEAVRDGNW